VPRSGRAALLLVDLQEDFLERRGLVPGRAELELRAAELLEGARALGLPVFHVHTVVRRDGGDRMRHWKEAERWECVEGTPGVRPPPSLAPARGEPLFAKQTFSAFDAPGLPQALAGFETLFLAGLYLHACVRATSLDAHARGFRVCIVEDAVGSTEPVHAEISRAYLEGRAARFATIEEALEASGRKPPPAARDVRAPVACIDGRWREAPAQARRLRHARPARLSELLAEVPFAEEAEVAAAAAAAARAHAAGRARDLELRAGWLEAWRRALADREAELVDAVVREVGKPRGEARAEVQRAGLHLASAIRTLRSEGPGVRLADGALVRCRARGVVGLVTPWNNPAAIPVGKIAPALAFGNAVVWKPACQAPETARLLMESLGAAGVPEGLVNLVFGEARTARRMLAERAIAAFSVTGSTRTGRSVAALCAHHGKALQAELGGNNAAVVLADCDVEGVAAGLAAAAFGFAGQRCTATRRFVVERAVADRFRDAFVAAAEGLRVGDPGEEATEVGPLVSDAQRRRVAAAVERASLEGGRVLCGGRVPAGLEAGAYFAPTVVADLPEDAHLVREETFGPVAVIQRARDVRDAIRLVNAVDQGLLATLCSGDPARRAEFLEAVEAGMLNLAPSALRVSADAPFVGWKASAIGPPEHGSWDREFYARPQTVYGAGADGV
jgi:acyl-CoA reductase-like NAD-dependent aldehyde dehydrogenase/nicotinamidase-related amidase